ncbi:squalene--hopene cyclase, partial [Staphylococcus sp. SIMBA_130]
MLEKEVDEKIEGLLSEALRNQHGNGAFHFCFENSLLTDAMMIVLIRMLKLPEKSLLDALVKRLLYKQSKEGYWKLYEDDRGDLSATVLAYQSLLYSGMITCKHSEMKKAEHYIKKWGGIERVDS